MVDASELAKVLGQISKPGADEALRKKAEALMAEATPAEVSIAEQKLLEGGLAPQELRTACDIHLGLLKRQNAPLREGLPTGHVLDTLYKEHDEILGFLDGLDQVGARVAAKRTYDPADPDWAALLGLGEHLVAAEAHHAREEDVLFPELETRGVDGPPRIMRLEHDQLRPRKRRLYELALGAAGRKDGAPVDAGNFAAVRREIGELAEFIVFNLRDHIFKENNILYPTALETIQDPALWADMKRRADQIGYCCFTPTA